MKKTKKKGKISEIGGKIASFTSRKRKALREDPRTEKRMYEMSCAILLANNVISMGKLAEPEWGVTEWILLLVCGVVMLLITLHSFRFLWSFYPKSILNPYGGGLSGEKKKIVKMSDEELLGLGRPEILTCPNAIGILIYYFARTSDFVFCQAVCVVALALAFSVQLQCVVVHRVEERREVDARERRRKEEEQTEEDRS